MESSDRIPRDLPALPRVRDSIVLRHLDGELVAYDSISHTLLHLNPAAAAVLEHCNGSRTLSEIVDRLAATYTTSRSMIEVGVRDTLQQLHVRGFLHAHPGSP